MKEFFRILISNFELTFFSKRVCFTIGLFILVFALKLDYIDNCINLQKFINTIFSTPSNLNNNILETLTWSLYQFYLLYIIGDYIYKEFTMRNIYVLCRIGSKIRYITYMYLNIFLICLIYYLIGVSIFFIIITILNKHVFLYSLSNILAILFELSISGYFLSTIYLMIFSIIKNHLMCFIVTIIYIYLSIIIKDNYNINLFISLSLNIFWRILLYTILIINLIITNKFIIKEDMTNYLS